MCEDCEAAGLRWQRERDEMRDQVSLLKTANDVSSLISV